MTPLRKDIQGIRAVAVLVVFLDHMLGWPTGGFVGVDMFFVISGFLITGGLLRTYEKTGHISARRFYASRAKRIFPAATLVLLVTVGAAFLIFNTQRAWSTLWDAFASFFFFANWRSAATGTDYFQQDAAVSPLQHYWSLSVEEQFYFVWPWLLLGLLAIFARFMTVTSQRMRLIAGSSVAVIIVASLGWALVQSVTSPTVAYFSTFTRAWELGIGALLAVCAPLFTRLPAAARTVVAYAGIGGMLASCFVITAETTWPAPWALLPTLSTAAVIASGIGAEARFIWPLTNPVSVYIGNISYSLYLWHYPVIIFGLALFPDADVLVYLGITIFGFGLAIAAYHLVERPLWKSPLWEKGANRKAWASWRATHRAEFRYAGLGGLTSVVALMVVIALIPPISNVATYTPVVLESPSESAADADPTDPLQQSLTTDIVAGLSTQSWPADIDAQMADNSVSDPDLVACSADPDKYSPDGCRWGSGSRLAVVVGDSIASAYIPTLKAVLGGSEWTIWQMTLNGCEFNTIALASERSEPYCADRVSTALANIASADVDAVFVSNQWRSHVDFTTGKSVPLNSWWDGASAALDQIVADRVIYLAPTPFEKSIDTCYTARASAADCTSVVSSSWLNSQALLETYATEHDQFRYVSSYDWFCYDDACPVLVRGLLTRIDGVHPGQAYLESIRDVISTDVASALAP